MPHLQRDHLHGRTIIVAEERAARSFGEGLAPPQDLRTALGPLASDTPVAKNGQYSLRVSTPLGLGNHQFVVRAVDEVGHPSHVSRVFTIKVVPPKHHTAVITGQATPQGPLASMPAPQSSSH